MFGIRFIGHPDLRRILMPEEFTAFPLRKDYPLRGRGERHNFPRLIAGRIMTTGAARNDHGDGMTDRIARPNPLTGLTEAKQATWTLNFGPQHPATHTTLRLILELDGERIVKATPDIGYLHSGFEKLGEHLNFNQYVTIVDRKNYISPPMNEVAWHHAVEKLLGIELTPRCQYIRVIISRAGAASAITCSAPAPPRSTWGRSPRFSTPSTCAS